MRGMGKDSSSRKDAATSVSVGTGKSGLNLCCESSSTRIEREGGKDDKVVRSMQRRL